MEERMNVFISGIWLALDPQAADTLPPITVMQCKVRWYSLSLDFLTHACQVPFGHREIRSL